MSRTQMTDELLDVAERVTNRLQMTGELLDVAKRVTDRLQATEERLMEYVEKEDEICPSGMTFGDYIADLKRQLADALAAKEKTGE